MKANEVSKIPARMASARKPVTNMPETPQPMEESPITDVQEPISKEWKWKHYPDEEDIKGVTPDVAAKIRNWD